MKKITLLLFAALFLFINVVPAVSMENQFGGYWYTRFYTNQNFTGEDQSEDQDMSLVDTRTRLYYTAVFHENLKFVNKFEFNTVWGDTDGGDIGADGTKDLRVKNSYADFNLGPVNFTVGIQGLIFSRGLLFDDDASGATVTYRSDRMDLQFFWLKAYEGGMGKNANDYDVDYYGFNPVFRVGSAWEINPFFMYIYSDDVRNWENEMDPAFGNAEEVNLWYAGLNLDANFDMFSFWLTGIYQGGDMSFYTTDKKQDFSAWLGAAGATVNIGEKADIHGQFFYATGQDESEEDWKRFWVPAGQSYYWAELMGYGIIDVQSSNNSPADQISNIMAANIGVTFKPVSNVSIALDVWYAALAEDIYVLNGAQYGKADAPANASKENYLGTEVDLVFSVELVQGLNLDLIGAYLFAGEATTLDSKDDANPYEIGAQLSLEF